MVQTIQAKEITLAQLSETFGLERTDDEQFFREWQDNLPELSDWEKQFLDEVRRDYLHLFKYPLLETYRQNGGAVTVIKIGRFLSSAFLSHG